MTATATAKTAKKTALLERWRALVDGALNQALPKASAAPVVVHEGMRYCVFSGGKRFRPLLCLGAAAAAGAPARAALPVACALELIHTYSLVHDDLPAMDNADERRGLPTAHRKFGEGNAVLVGDALLTLAFELLCRNPSTRPQQNVHGRASLGIVPSKRSASRDNSTPNALAVIRTISEACGTTGLIGGQVMDLQAVSRVSSSTEQALREIARQKTGALIAASVVSGGLAAGGSAAQLKALKRYGNDLGLAFQLIDDIHDREGLAVALGLDEAARQAQNLITRATAQLKPFGEAGRGLREIAAWLAATR